VDAPAEGTGSRPQTVLRPGHPQRGPRVQGWRPTRSHAERVDRLRIQAEAHGYFTRPQALADGYDDKAIRRALRAAQWTRIRQGVYTYPDLWTQADARARHRALAHAVASRLGDRVVLSHVSAAERHGLDLWDVDLDRVHLTRLDGATGRTEAGIVHHEGTWAPQSSIVLGGVLVVPAARAALETALLTSTESALVTLDSALHAGCTREELESAAALMAEWPGSRRLRVALRLADGRADSVGESRTRYLFYLHHLPAPELQFKVRDHRGQLAGTCDFAWPDHRLLGEFDGKVKYGRLRRPEETPEDAVFREKRREDRLRELTGWSMVRVTWGDLYQGVATAARVRRLLTRAA
jgi:hypothetical protein